MKKIILTLLVICSLSIFAKAQTAAPTTFGWNEKNLKELGCNAEQIAKILKIKQDATDKRSKVMADTTIKEKELKLQRGKILRDRNEEMMDVLTPEQRKAVVEIEKKLKEAAKGG